MLAAEGGGPVAPGKDVDVCLGIPGRITRTWLDRGTPMASVDFGGAVKDVCLAYLPDIEIGDYAVVHAGFALTRLDEESALATLAMFAELGILDEELGGVGRGRQ
jgi:hydrogenase expression/formation protein HypC